jgi:hypothetical protein
VHGNQLYRSKLIAKIQEWPYLAAALTFELHIL